MIEDRVYKDLEELKKDYYKKVTEKIIANKDWYENQLVKLQREAEEEKEFYMKAFNKGMITSYKIAINNVEEILSRMLILEGI